MNRQRPMVDPGRKEARMTSTNTTPRLATLFGAALLGGLTLSPTALADDGKGTLKVILDSDPAAGILGGTLKVSKVWAHLAEPDGDGPVTREWFLVDDDVSEVAFAFPLVLPSALGSTELRAGVYDDLRLHVIDGEIYTLTGSYPLMISEDDIAVLDFFLYYCVDEGDTTVLRLRVDTDQYLRWSPDDDAFILKPNLTLDDDRSCGD